MNKMKYTIFCFILGIQSLLASNTIIKVVTKDSKTPIEGVNIYWKALGKNKKQGFATTTLNGEISLPLAKGDEVSISATHIGYKKITQNFSLKQTNYLFLEEDLFNLSQVIVSGHSRPTLIDSSLYSVKVIDKQKIVSSGATSLGDLLLTEPNINLKTDFILGTKIEMLGMSGSNVKIMIDGVPVIGRLNGSIDLNQITVDNVDHIEIIEGPMSVVYGNNALAGTINIITNKNTYFNTDASVSTSYESAKRYNGAIDVSKKIGQKTIFNISSSYSNFLGIDFHKENRAMEWKPQQQYTAKGGILFNYKDWSINTKASFYNSKVTKKGNIHLDKAFDTYFYTDRYTGSVNIDGKWSETNNLSILLSHNFYNRSSKEETKLLTTLEKITGEKKSSQKEYNSLLRAIWNKKLSSKFNIESGIDFNLSSMKGERIKDEEQSLNDYAGFLNIRYSPLQNLEIQPGFRFAYNTDYDAPLLYSVNAKWNIIKDFSLRASIAKGYRAPTVKELYLLFINSNHEIYGNSNLKAEKSKNYNVSADYHFKWQNNSIKLNGQLYYNDIQNLITLVEKKNATGYQYDNISYYKTKGGSLGFNFLYKRLLKFNFSTIVTGRLNRLKEISNTRKYNTTIDHIAGIQLKEPNTKIKLDVDLKLYGEQNYFIYSPDNQIKEGRRDSYEMLNASMSRTFFKDKLNVTIGAKNLTNIKTVNSSGSSGHSSSEGTPIAYGTNYFIKAIFRIKQ